MLFSRFRILNHLLAGIHEYYHTAIFARRQAFVVFIVAHTFHLLELRGRYAAILQIILYGIGTVLGHLHVGFVRTDLVRMAYDGDVRSCVFLQNLGEVAQGSFRIVAQRRGVESKQNTGVERHLDGIQIIGIFHHFHLCAFNLGGFGSLFIHLMTDSHTCARTYRCAYCRTDSSAFTLAEQSADNSSCRSARATAEALPLRDAFAVLFFVSVGMLFDPAALLEQWPLFLLALGVIVLLKPLLAFLVCLAARKPLRLAVSVGLSLGQIGEFTFILIAMGVSFGLFDSSISNAVIPAALLSITLNPLLFRRVGALARLLARLGLGARLPRMEHGQTDADGLPRVVVVGFGPVGRSLCRIVRAHGMLPVVVEANIDTVRRLRGLGRPAVHGDATQAEVLREAGLAQAQALLLSAPAIPAREVVPIARAINPDLRIFVNTPFASEADSLRSMGVEGAFSGEREVALSMSRFLLDDLGVGRTGLEAELERVREVFAESPSTQKS